MPLKKGKNPKLSYAAKASILKMGGTIPKKYARTVTKSATVKENRIVAKVMSRVAENKILPVKEYVKSPGYPIQTLAQGYMFAGVLGDIPTSWNGAYWNPLGSITPAAGVGTNQRIGNQYFLKKTHLTLSVDAGERKDPLPMEFRTIVAKPRRAFNPSGTTVDPYTNLFMNGNGVNVGPGTGGISAPQLFNSMINLRDFVVYSDTNDTIKGSATALQDPSTTTVFSGPSYKGFYRKRFNLPHNMKCHVNENGKISNYDPAYFVVILARTLDQAGAAGRWNFWLQGTTSYNDS